MAAKTKTTKKVIKVPEMGMTEISKIIESVSSKESGDTPIISIDKEKLSKVPEEALKPYVKSTIDQRALIKDFQEGKLCAELRDCFESKTVSDTDLIVAYALFDRIVNGFKTKLGDTHNGFKQTLDSLANRIKTTSYADIVAKLVEDGVLSDANEIPVFEIGDALSVTLANGESTTYSVKEAELKNDAVTNPELIPDKYKTMVMNLAAFEKVINDAVEQSSEIGTVRQQLLNSAVVSNNYNEMKDNYKKDCLEENLKPYIVESTAAVTKMTRKELK